MFSEHVAIVTSLNFLTKQFDLNVADVFLSLTSKFHLSLSCVKKHFFFSPRDVGFLTPTAFFKGSRDDDDRRGYTAIRKIEQKSSLHYSIFISFFSFSFSLICY